MNKVIGLDIGTTYSSLSAMINNKPTLIPNYEGYNLTPTIISYNRDNQLLIGEEAKKQYLMNPKHTYTLLYDKDKLVEKVIIKKLINDACLYFHTSLNTIVLSLPSHFRKSQYNEIQLLCNDLGIHIKKFISKPNAIALAYGLNHCNELIMIVHLDEAYYEVSIIEIEKNSIEVLGHCISPLKANDYHLCIVQYLVDCFKNEYNIDLSDDFIAMSRIHDASYKAKKELFTSSSTHILIPFIKTDKYGPLNLDVVLTKTKFNQITKHLNEQLEISLYNALNDARLLPSELDKILLIGQTTRLSSIQDKIKQVTGVSPSLAMNHNEYFSIGCVIASNDDILIKEKTIP